MTERELRRKDSQLGDKEKTNYELRLEFNGNAFRCRWFKVGFYKHNSTGRLLKNYEVISEPINGKYGREKFKKANDWEIEIITYAGIEFAPIRNKTKHLMKAHQNILYAAKAGSIEVKVKPQVTRVEKSELTIASIKSKLRG